MTTINFKHMALAGGLMLAIGGAAVAQTAPPPAGQPRHEMRQKIDPAQMAAKRAQRLRDVLQLRQDQEPALQAFLASHKRPEGPRPNREAFKNLTTPQRLDQMAARMNERQAQFQKHVAATKAFYAALTPAQQKAFDAMPRGGGRMKGHGRMGGKMGGGMMRHGPNGAG